MGPAALNLYGTDVGGYLDCSEGRFVVSGNFHIAVDARFAEIAGSVFFTPRFQFYSQPYGLVPCLD